MLVAYTLEPSESEPGFLSRLANPKAHSSLSRRLPYLIYFAWTKVLFDEFVTDDMRLPAASESESLPVVDAEIQDGQDLMNATLYVNYALFGTRSLEGDVWVNIWIGFVR